MRLKLLLFNVQDGFLKLAYPVEAKDLAALSEAEWQLLAPTDAELKPLAKLRGWARVFAAEQPDVAMFCEIGGPEALANFSRLFLDDRYAVHATPPLSDRGIETGYLVRRDLPVRAELVTHAEEPVVFEYLHEQDPDGCAVNALLAPTLDLGAPDERRLSRDVPELRLYQQNAAAGAPPAVVLVLAHLKSAFDPDGIDRRGAVRRAAEAKTLLKIRRDIQTQVGAHVPVLIAGDLNGRAARPDTDPEFAEIYEATDLVDVLEVAGRERYERVTQITFHLGKGEASQLDYIFIPQALALKVDKAATYVHHFAFPEGDGEIAMPGSLRERWQLPSDHYPVVTALEIDGLGT